MNTLSSRERFHRILSEATKQFDQYKAAGDLKAFLMAPVLVAIGKDMHNSRIIIDDAWRAEATKLLVDAGLKLSS